MTGVPPQLNVVNLPSIPVWYCRQPFGGLQRKKETKHIKMSILIYKAKSFHSVFRTYSYRTLHGIWVILISQNLLKALANVKAKVAESDAAIPTSKYTRKNKSIFLSSIYVPIILINWLWLLCCPEFSPQITGTFWPVFWN